MPDFKDRGPFGRIRRLLSPGRRPTLEEQLRQAGRPTAAGRTHHQSWLEKFGLQGPSRRPSTEEQLRERGMQVAPDRELTSEQGQEVLAAYRHQVKLSKSDGWFAMPPGDFPRAESLREEHRAALDAKDYRKAKELSEYAWKLKDDSKNKPRE